MASHPRTWLSNDGYFMLNLFVSLEGTKGEQRSLLGRAAQEQAQCMVMLHCSIVLVKAV